MARTTNRPKCLNCGNRRAIWHNLFCTLTCAGAFGEREANKWWIWYVPDQRWRKAETEIRPNEVVVLNTKE